MVSSLLLLKLGLLVFWSLWFGVVFTTNLCEGFKVLRWIPWTWKFASHNFQAVESALNEYAAPAWLPHVLFAGILFWQCFTVLLFGWATLSSLVLQTLQWEFIDAAFAAGLGLWAIFMLADEVCKQYDLERAHGLFFIAQLLTLTSLHLLPD